MKAIILAAGKGKRLHSEQFTAPKVLREANGRPLLRYVVENLDFIPEKKDIVIVVGYRKEMVTDAFQEGYTFAVRMNSWAPATQSTAPGMLLRTTTGRSWSATATCPSLRRKPTRTW